MTPHHAKQLLDSLMHHASPELRAKTMREVPAAYNAYHAREIVAVVSGKDSAELTPPSPANADGGTPRALVAEILADAHARLQAPRAFTTEAFALDGEGEEVSDGTQIRARAVRYDLLGAIEAATADVNLQALATRAVVEAHTETGEWANLLTLSQKLGHAGVLELLERAGELARSKPWEDSRFADRTPLPDTPPTREEWEARLLQLQGIDELFFGPAKECAGQYMATPSMCDFVSAERDAIDQYLRTHEKTVKAIERAIARETRRQARAQWRQAISAEPLATIERSARGSAKRLRHVVAKLARRLAAKRIAGRGHPNNLPF